MVEEMRGMIEQLCAISDHSEAVVTPDADCEISAASIERRR